MVKHSSTTPHSTHRLTAAAGNKILGVVGRTRAPLRRRSGPQLCESAHTQFAENIRDDALLRESSQYICSSGLQRLREKDVLVLDS